MMSGGHEVDVGGGGGGGAVPDYKYVRRFCHSSVSVYYTERKPKSKNKEDLGMRLFTRYERSSTSDVCMVY